MSLTEASCTLCGRPQQPGAWRCTCGGPLELPETSAAPLARLGPLDRREEGLWRYGASIPVSPVPGLSMGEGQTPLLPGEVNDGHPLSVAPKGAGGLAAEGGLQNVFLKLEFLSPTLSFKDRGAAVLVASALARGAQRLIADSSGNAGSAIAAYGARAGLDCKVYVPEQTSAAKQAQIRVYGAAVERVAGDRSAAMDAAIDAVERSGATYASHVFDPFFLQGTKTFAYEVFEQLGRAPRALVLPVGNGTLLLGAARGFAELHHAQLIERPPALIGLQSERCQPLVAAWQHGAAEAKPVRAESTVAEGIAVPRPPRAAQILAAVVDSGGCLLAVPEAAIAPAQRDLARRGLFVEPTAALVWAGALILRRHRAVTELVGEEEGWEPARELAAETLVVPLCGAGLKSGAVAVSG